MHRRKYQGTKFHRERDQREALIKSLAEALITKKSIKTTLPKAKAVVPYVEKLVTKAKKGDLHNRRMVIAGLQTISTAHTLVDEIAPKLQGRTSGHFRITRVENRRGDNAEMARVSFVDDLQSAPVAVSAAEAKPKAEKPEAKAKVAAKSAATKAAEPAKETK
jgi:large subunit ribosomal protein L17